MSALGIDVAGIADVDLFLNSADAKLSAAEAVMRSLLHDPGKLWWAPQRGYSLLQHLHGFFDRERIERAVRNQCEQEERVESAEVSAEKFGSELLLTIKLSLTDDDSRVTLTLSVNDVGEILSAGVQ